MAPSRRAGRPTVTSGRQLLVSCAVILVGASAARGLECDPGICVGDPCTITGTHEVAADCGLQERVRAA
jgi:hypothetical protein